jgi:hypothetical protein
MDDSSTLSVQRKGGANCKVHGYHLVRLKELSTISVTEAFGYYKHRATWQGIYVPPQGQREETGSFWAVIVVIQGRDHLLDTNAEQVLTYSRELLDGKYEISQFCVPGIGKMSLHSDIPAAKNTIAKIRILEKNFGFHVALAHDARWLKDGSDEVLMSLLDEHMKQAARERISNDEIP